MKNLKLLMILAVAVIIPTHQIFSEEAEVAQVATPEATTSVATDKVITPEKAVEVPVAPAAAPVAPAAESSLNFDEMSKSLYSSLQKTALELQTLMTNAIDGIKDMAGRLSTSMHELIDSKKSDEKVIVQTRHSNNEDNKNNQPAQSTPVQQAPVSPVVVAIASPGATATLPTPV